MTDRFDPNFPPTLGPPPFLAIEGEVTRVTVTEQPAIGLGNAVVNRAQSFDIDVDWHVFGNVTPLWLGALAPGTPDWVVTAYAESLGPGPEVSLGSVTVPVGGPPFSVDVSYTAKITVPPVTLPEEDPGNPNEAGIYKITVTTFLDSAIGGPFDMIGFAEGPTIKVEDPE
jgi:hypothetical protein